MKKQFLIAANQGRLHLQFRVHLFNDIHVLSRNVLPEGRQPDVVTDAFLLRFLVRISSTGHEKDVNC